MGRIDNKHVSVQNVMGVDIDLCILISYRKKGVQAV